MKVYTCGKHREKRANEILIGWYSKAFFNNMIAWDSKRLGKDFRKYIDLIKYPVFIDKEEVKKKGWKVY